MALSKIDVANMLTGATPVANGGTGLTSGTTNQFLKFTGSTAIGTGEAGGGKVLQVQEFHYTSYLSRTDSSSFDDGLHVDITPSSTSSKVLVLPVAQLTKTGTSELIYRLFRQTGGTGDSGWTTASTRVGTDIGGWTGSTSQANHFSNFWQALINTWAHGPGLGPFLLSSCVVPQGIGLWFIRARSPTERI